MLEPRGGILLVESVEAGLSLVFLALRHDVLIELRVLQQQ